MSTGNEQPTDVRDSTPNSNSPDGAAGGMGVSSERVGHAGPGQERTDGVLDSTVADVEAVPPLEGADEGAEAAEGDDVPPEQRPGAREDNPMGLAPKAGYPSRDPRSDEKPFENGPEAMR